MTHTIEMPALDGRRPLGFLAALGLLNVLSDAGADPLRLSFSPSNAAAVIHSPLASLDEVATLLAGVTAAAGEAAAIPGVNTGFPLRAGRNADPMRRPREDYRKLAEELRSIDERAVDHWLPCLLTDLAVDRQGRADITPFNAPSGKQNLRTFFAKPLDAVRAHPSRLREALIGWRRAEGFTGEYFDHHALNSAADDPLGRTSAENGVPGATWLATMAIPLLRLSGDGYSVAATLWHRTGRRSVMIWPLWRQPLDRPAVQALLEHPCLTPIDPTPTIRSTEWEALGITGVYGAERQPIPRRKFPGVLAPIQVSTVS
jgi:CRISPR-associated endonuclease/helicase Cas3